MQEASVLGQGFTSGRGCFERPAGSGGRASAGRTGGKQVLGVQAARAGRARPVRVPAGAVAEVADGTLSRRDRKARHVAAVAALEQSFRGADRRCRRCSPPTSSRPSPPPRGPGRRRVGLPRVRRSCRRATGARLGGPREGPALVRQAATLASDEPSLQAELLSAGRHARLPGRQHRRGATTARAGNQRSTNATVTPFAAARAGIALADVDKRRRSPRGGAAPPRRMRCRPSSRRARALNWQRRSPSSAACMRSAASSSPPG